MLFASPILVVLLTLAAALVFVLLTPRTKALLFAVRVACL